MIVFKTIRYKNFLSTGNIFTEIFLDKHNTTLIVGDNGSGKSTILDALTFGLFGKPFRKINKPQLLNTITRKDLVVEIEFSIGSNNYKIVRGIKPAVFELYKNGSLLNQSAESKDYQEILEKQIIKVNFKSFCQVVVLGSATFQPFMQLSTGQRREVIEDLLDLQIFTVMNVLLKNKISDNNQMLSDCMNNKKIIEEKIKLIKEHLAELNNNNEQIIEEKKQRINEAQIEIESLSKTIEDVTNNIKALSEKIIQEKKLKSKAVKLDELKYKIQANLSVLKKDIDFFNKNDDCPTCKQLIEEKFKEQTILEKQKEVEKIEDGLKVLEEQYSSISKSVKEIEKVHSQINSYKLEESRYNTKISSLTSYIVELNRDIKSMISDKKQDNNHKITDLEAELEKITIEYSSLNEHKNILNSANALLKDGGIKAKIVKQYVPIINKLINKYLSALDFYIQFELNEEFKETIKSRYRDEFSYDSFSEGEKMKINLSILFTWRAVAKLRNSINTNLLIMDEVFDSSLDSNGTEEFLKLLNNLTKDTNTFIISHKTDQLIDKFENVLKFQKKQNFSKVA